MTREATVVSSSVSVNFFTNHYPNLSDPFFQRNHPMVWARIAPLTSILSPLRGARKAGASEED